jgi:CheY-like chemotaxis protein
MTSTKKILFVDDDPQLLEVMRMVLSQLAGPGWIISTAENVAEALSIIQDQQIDLIVVDLHMPVVDGVQFLGLLNRKYPDLIKVVLTSDVTEEQRAVCLSQGAELYLQKPRAEHEWRTIQESLDALVQFKPQEGFRGVLRRVGLSDVLQMECLSRHSALLEISTNGARGHIYIKEGQIIHAEMGERSGEEAFNYLMHLTGGEFAQKPFVEPLEQTISQKWEFLLMEAARKQDESAESVYPGIDLNAFTTPTPLPKLSREETQFIPRLEQPPVEQAPPRPQVAEFVVLSSQGDVIHEWQCEDVNARVNFLEFVSQKARQLGQGLQLGSFEAFEIYGSKSRIITQLENDHAIFVKTELIPTNGHSYA